MNLNDFHFMRRGETIQQLTPLDAHWLAPIDIRGPGTHSALLMLHGYGSTPAVYRALTPSLSTKYDALVCPVLTGHCDSIAAFSQATAREWMTCAERALSSLLTTYQTVDVLGLSLGGLLACNLSHHHALHHLYLLAPSLALKTICLKPTLIAARALQTIGLKKLRNHGGNLHTNQYAELLYNQLPLPSIIEILTLIDNYRWKPPPCPVDLFLGYFDAVVDSKKIAKRFAHQPNINTHWLMHSAHVLPLDGDIDTLIEIIQP